MLKKLLGAAAAFALLAPAMAPAQTAPAPAKSAPAVATKDADPALWVIKDKDTTIYLFGTVHVLKPGLSWFDEAVKTAFDKSDELVLEMVEPDQATMQGLILKTAVNPKGPTITEQLPEDKRAAYAAEMADAGAPSAAMFDHFDPWFVALTLSLAPLPKLGYDPNSGAERTLAAAAKAANKPVSGLETPDQQIGFLDGLPPKVQLAYLVSTIDDYSKMGPTLDKMVASWAAGDPDSLARAMNQDMDKIPELAQALLFDRNANWAKWIEARMAKPGTVFLAVGAGHLAGDKSVQSFLARDHVKVTRIQY